MTHDWPAFVRAHLSHTDRNLDPDVLDELAAHVADLYAEAIAHGRTEDEALSIARAALPSDSGRLALDVSRARQSLPGRVAAQWADAAATPAPRARWTTRVLAGGRGDVVIALRSLRQAPGHTLVVLLTLALGIGAVSAMFAAVDTVLLRPLPYADAARIVVPVSVNAERGTDDGSISYADHVDWQQETGTFDAVALWRPTSADLTGAGQPERIRIVQTSRDFFRVVAVTPILGRTLAPGDYAAAAPRVAVISEGLWQRMFGGAPDVVGRTARIGGTPYVIVGVLPARTSWPAQADAFVPLRAITDADILTRRDNMIFNGIARLREDVTIEQGTAVLETIAARLAREFPESRAGWTNRLVTLRDYMVDDALARALWVLAAAVVVLLLIGCANLAHLGLVRGLGRARDLGIRVALGASRWRLARQLIVEHLLLAFAGAAAGTMLAHWMIRGLVALAPEGTPFVGTLSLDVRVLAGAVLATGLTVLIAGVIPALATARIDPGPALKAGTPGAGSSRAVGRLRHALIVLELSAAVVLLCGAGLLLQSFWRLQRVDPGVDVDGVLTARLTLPGADRYENAAQVGGFFEQLIDRLTASPAVESAGATSFVPIGGGGFGLDRVFLAEGQPEPPASADVAAQWNVVTPEYFETLGIPVLQGRAFTRADRADTTPVIIVSRSFAAQMFGRESPLGRRVRSWRDENVLREIVGVVDEVHYRGLNEPRSPRQVYVPHSQSTWSMMNVVARAAGDPASLERAVRQAVRELDADLAVSNVATLRQIAWTSIARERYAALLLALFAAAALALGTVGVYGVINHAVSARRRELAVRAALGASPRTLYGLVFRHAAGIAVIGAGLGLAASVAAGRALQRLLYQTSAADPLVYAATTFAILLTVAGACLAPARRAGRADPLTALRAD